MGIEKLASCDRQDRNDGRDALYTLAIVALKAEYAARCMVDGAKELATLAGIAELVIVVGATRAQAWVRQRTTRIGLTFVQ
jgi:hypothetical protein